VTAEHILEAPLAEDLDVLLTTGLVGEVRLRRLTALDADAFAAHVAADLARLSEFLPWPARTSTPPGAAEWLARYDRGEDGRKLAAGVMQDGALVAGMVLLNHDEAAAIIELGCWSVAAAEGRGVVRAACVEGLRLARSWGVERVEWHCDPQNSRSGALARRLGFQLEGTLRSAYPLRGERRDTEVYGLIGTEIDEAIDQVRR
jgi:RimJ/RimL family protein N-acetyltransferase